MAGFNITRNTFLFGTQNADDLTARNMNVAIGLRGDDTLRSEGSGGALVGGRGNDTYLAQGGVTQISENGGDDWLVLPGLKDDYIAGFIDQNTLGLFNQWTGDSVLVLNFKGDGRIEHFQDASGLILSANQVESLVYTQSLGDISQKDIEAQLGLYGIGEGKLPALLEVDAVYSNLNWDNVFTRLSQAQTTAPDVVASIINDEAYATLSDAGKQFWNQHGLDGILARSEFANIEANVDLPPEIGLQQVQDVALLYEAALDRQPDDAGLNYFVGNLEENQSLQDIANSFYLADEFRDQFSRFDNESYINQLYQNVLDRPADSAGLEYWLDDIEQLGRSHADVLVSFAQSAENRGNAADWLAGLHHDEQTDAWLV